MPKLCKHQDCERRVFAKGYCQQHQSQREDKKLKATDKEIDLPTLLELAQKVFNTYIRTRDKNVGCISCSTRKVEHAGHYYPQGSCSYLRFDEMNVNGQCEFCNTVLSGNGDMYFGGLVERYGTSKVITLSQRSNTNRMYKWSREELKEIIATYKEKTKMLNSEQEVKVSDTTMLNSSTKAK